MIKRLSLLAASLILATSATAGTVSGGPFTTALELTDFSNVAAGSINKFDPQGRTLSKVVFTISIDLEAVLSLLNGDDVNNVSAGASILATATVAGKSFGVTATGGVSGEDLVEDVQQDFDIAAYDTSVFNVAPADWALFSAAGGGTLGITCSTVTTAVNPLGLDSVTVRDGSAYCFGDIEYTFDDAPPTNGVPEPGTLALMGLALAGMGFTARRRNAT